MVTQRTILLLTVCLAVTFIGDGHSFVLSRSLANDQSSVTEPSTNVEFIYLTDFGNYQLYKLNSKQDSNQAQALAANKFMEKFLQESYETTSRSYPDVIHFCGGTMLAFLPRNATLSLKNMVGLLLARLEAYDNSQYVCFLSVLKQHREQGLGTRLLSEMINDAVRARNTRLSLHVNTENQNALSVYLKCGMRCAEYFPNFYLADQANPTQHAFGMTLQIRNVKNPTAVCQSTDAVQVSEQEDTLYKQRCPQVSSG